MLLGFVVVFVAGFTSSVSVFRTMPCYHPANFQTRALTCTGGPTKADGGGAHNVMRDASGVAETEPDVAAAIEAYWSLSWVGIAEFYHASKCLYGGNGNVFEPFLNVPPPPQRHACTMPTPTPHAPAVTAPPGRNWMLTEWCLRPDRVSESGSITGSEPAVAVTAPTLPAT